MEELFIIASAVKLLEPFRSANSLLAFNSISPLAPPPIGDAPPLKVVEYRLDKLPSLPCCPMLNGLPLVPLGLEKFGRDPYPYEASSSPSFEPVRGRNCEEPSCISVSCVRVSPPPAGALRGFPGEVIDGEFSAGNCRSEAGKPFCDPLQPGLFDESQRGLPCGCPPPFWEAACAAAKRCRACTRSSS